MSLPDSLSFGDPRRSPGTLSVSPAVSPGLSYYGSPRPSGPSELDVTTVPSVPELLGRCLHCSAPAQTFLCWWCVGMLRRQLIEVPWLLRRLRESAYGEAKVARKGGPRVSTGERLPSLPLNTRAADMLRDAARLVAWCEQVSGVDRGGPHDAARVESAARWLSGAPGAMMAHPWAPDALGWVLQWRQDAERVIDLPPDTRYAGPCQNVVHPSGVSAVGLVQPPRECGTPLYVDSEALVAECYRCGCSWRVEDLQRQALDRVDEAAPRTQADMWRLLKLIGRDVPRSTFFRLMAGVEACGYNADGLPVYMYAAVVAVLDARDAAAAARRAAGKPKRGRPRKKPIVDAHTEPVDMQTIEALPSAPKEVTG